MASKYNPDELTDTCVCDPGRMYRFVLEGSSMVNFIHGWTLSYVLRMKHLVLTAVRNVGVRFLFLRIHLMFPGQSPRLGSLVLSLPDIPVHFRSSTQITGREEFGKEATG
ncbi:hypothetical protein RUM43_003501 [Polyplax serrata]|uniref:Uncharacterized protein n=1 Tax=Polyplax serrata TaxID=468196 RepID=A0AAN8PEU5_POLSC